MTNLQSPKPQNDRADLPADDWIAIDTYRLRPEDRDKGEPRDIEVWTRDFSRKVCLVECFWPGDEAANDASRIERAVETAYFIASLPRMRRALQDAEQEIHELLADLCDEPDEDISANRTLATIRGVLKGAVEE